MPLSHRIAEAEQAIRQLVPELGELPRPQTAIILGSGLGVLAERIKADASIAFSELPGFVPATAPGHRGRLVIGSLGGQQVVCTQGRLHGYEGNSPASIVFPLYVMHALGAERLIVTNAAGAINEGFSTGDMMLISDHINFTGDSPLVLDADTDVPLSGFDMTWVYTEALRELAKEAASDLGLELREGVYLGLRGPTFETPAEIRAFRRWGADAVGMSTVYEAIVASALGMSVLGLSLMSNMAAGIEAKRLTVEDVQEAAEQCEQSFCELLEGIMRRLP
jgi:purine-nucleoside phosphorylase